MTASGVPKGVRVEKDELPNVEMDGYRDAFREPGKFSAKVRAAGGFTRVFLTIFAIFWNGFLIVWYGIAFALPETPILMLVFPIIHVAVGLTIGWTVLVSWINRTHIELSQGRFYVINGPLWSLWDNDHELDLSEIEHFATRPRRPKNSGRTRPAAFHDLMGHHKAGRKQLLKKALSTEVAEYLAERLNAHLEASGE